MEAGEQRGNRKRRKGIREAGMVLRGSPASGEGEWAIWGGALCTLTFLEHPVDREAEHLLLKEKSLGAKSPKLLPTYPWLSGAALGRKQLLTVWNHLSTTKELRSC